MHRKLNEIFSSTEALPRQISSDEHDEILSCMDVLNYLFTTFKDTGKFPLAPQVRGKFKDKKDKIKNLVSYGILIEEHRNSPASLKLSFVGFLYCNSDDAKAAKEYIGRIYTICKDWFEIDHLPITQPFKEVCKKLNPMYPDEISVYCHRLLLLFSTTPMPIFYYSAAENEVTLMADNITLSIVENITDYQDAEEYFKACFAYHLKQYGHAINDTNKKTIGLDDEELDDFISKNEFETINNARIKEFIVELNLCWKVKAPNACILLLRALISNSLDYYYKNKDNKPNEGLKSKLNYFLKNESLEMTTREAMVNLLNNAKILGDIAAHSKNVLVSMSDVAHCRTSVKVLLLKIAKQG